MTGAEGNEAKVAERPRETPGRRLRRARERRELSVATVASALHLNRGVVESLENDDYEKLPPITFVKGYLRVYARYLSLPEAEVLGAFDRLGVREEARPLGGRAASQARRESAMRGPSPLPWLLMLLAALVVVAAGYLWYREGSVASLTSLWSSQEPVASEAAPSEDPPAADDLPAATDPEPSSTDSSPAQAAVEEEKPASGSKDVGGETVSEPAASESAAVSPSPANESRAAISTEPPPTSGEPPQPTQSAAGDGSESATAPVADGSATPAAPPVADGEEKETQAAADAAADPNREASPTAEEGFDTLEFRFQGESWIEVRDARGERLLFGLVSEPGTRELKGVPPFEIVVGSVDQVSLSHNGEAVNLSARARGQVARFTLGSDG